jgi:hypothetical protein
MVVVVASRIASSTMKDCSKEPRIGHITNLIMDPPAPVAGQFAIVKLDYTLDKDVIGGKAKYEAFFNGFPLPPTTDDLCTDLPCPLLTGPIHYEEVVQMGDATTHGTLDAKVTWTDQDDETIVCWEFVVRI